MAWRATALWRSKLTHQIGRTRSFSTASDSKPKSSSKADFTPMYLMGGFVLAALGMGAHLMKQQLVHYPSVSMSKKRRGSMPEVEEPGEASISGNKFKSKSFQRKVASIHDDSNSPLPFPTK